MLIIPNSITYIAALIHVIIHSEIEVVELLSVSSL